MKYYLDTEFDGFGGPLISLALIREDRESLYLVYQETANDPWVQKNVIPHLWSIPSPLPGMAYNLRKPDANWWSLKPINKFRGKLPGFVGAHLIENFLAGDINPQIITDWPDDVAYMSKALITSPGHMISVPRLSFHMVRENAWPCDPKLLPTSAPGPTPHNAWWDAWALKALLQP